MALITWDDGLSVGIRAIDDQHKGLLQALNDLHNAMIQGLAKQATAPLLDKLVKYTRDHFAAEEAMLRRANYPNFANHKAKHVELTHQVEDYIARFQKGDIGLTVHLLDFLRNWLTNHIRKVDRDYGPWLNQHGVR